MITKILHLKNLENIAVDVFLLKRNHNVLLCGSLYLDLPGLMQKTCDCAVTR